ncbi:16S ribosomal RNA methyltransferase RsmE [Candidatus Nanopelagicaceae bacterium]
MLTLFFVQDLPTTIGSNYEFEGDDAGHAIRVLRTQIGESLALSNGQGAWSVVEVITISKKSMTVRVSSSGIEEALPVEFTIAQALTKGDRIKEAIELNTAGGADVILLWAAARSIGKATPDLMQKLAVTAREASKQSRRNRIPFVMGVLDVKKIAAEITNYDLAIVLHESALDKLSEVVTAGAKKVLVIIGPEGGLTDEELELFASAGAKVAHMGRPVFRSAHAGMAALSGLNTALKIW